MNRTQLIQYKVSKLVAGGRLDLKTLIPFIERLIDDEETVLDEIITAIKAETDERIEAISVQQVKLAEQKESLKTVTASSVVATLNK